MDAVVNLNHYNIQFGFSKQFSIKKILYYDINCLPINALPLTGCAGRRVLPRTAKVPIIVLLFEVYVTFVGGIVEIV